MRSSRMIAPVLVASAGLACCVAACSSRDGREEAAAGASAPVASAVASPGVGPSAAASPEPGVSSPPAAPGASAASAPSRAAGFAGPPDEPEYTVEELARCCGSLARAQGDLVRRKYQGHARQACRGYLEQVRRGQMEPLDGIRSLQTFFRMIGPTQECVPPAADAGAPDAGPG